MQFFPFLASLLAATASAKVLTLEELTATVDHLSVGDYPLVRYTVSDETYDRQEESCKDFNDFVETLKDGPTVAVKGKAAEMIAICVNERPEHRVEVAKVEGFHKAVVSLLAAGGATEAAELIYISVYASNENHAGFNEVGAVDNLMNTVMDETEPRTLMWSLAALANMAASYCDGYCSWYWGSPSDKYRDEEEEEEEETEEHPPILLTTDDVTIDSTLVRQHIVDRDGFLDRVFELVCSSVALSANGVPFPDTSAKGTSHVSIVPWAGVGLIKNLALDMGAHTHLEFAMPCLCWLTKSEDDLEYSKAYSALHNLDREYSCHWKNETETGLGDLCVDEYFIASDGGYMCHELEDTEEDCALVDEFDRKASETCCVCDGGRHYTEPTFDDSPSEGEL